MRSLALCLIVLAFLITGSCKKSGSGSYTPDCTSTTPKFSTGTSQLIASSCAISGCHANGSKNGPGALITYEQIKKAASDIRSSVVKGSMPEKSSLSNEQRNLIVCWIDAGANND